MPKALQQKERKKEIRKRKEKRKKEQYDLRKTNTLCLLQLGRFCVNYPVGDGLDKLQKTEFKRTIKKHVQ